jgi:hypothetical protein
VMSLCVVESYQLLRRPYCLHFQSWRVK